MPAGHAAPPGEEGVRAAGMASSSSGSFDKHAGWLMRRTSSGVQTGRAAASAGSAKAETLKSSPMPRPAPVKRASARVDGRGLRRHRAALERRGARSRCRAREEAPCVTGPCTAAPCGARRRGELREIDMDGEVGFARLGERVDKGVAGARPAACRRRPAHVAVVDDERRAAAVRAERRRSRAPMPRAASGLSRTSPGRPASRRARLGLADEAEGEPAIRAKPDEALAPAASARTNWRTGSASKNSLATTTAARPATSTAAHARRSDGAAGKRALLRLAQHRARLDKVHPHRSAEIRATRAARRHVRHQRAAPRAELDERERAGRPIAPDLDRPQAEEFAEHLADLRRGDEIARRAERIAGRVVAMHRMAEAERHVALDRDRAVGGDEPAQLVLSAASRRGGFDRFGGAAG